MIINNQKRLISNSILLYFRMAVVMLVTLYTSRFVLRELGFVDFGIFSLVSSFVAMFAFFGSSLSNSTQRYLSLYIETNDNNNLFKVVAISRIVFFLLSVLVTILLETIGLFILNYELDIPVSRIDSTNLVFHLMVFSTFITINGLLYYAVLMARQRLRLYAILGLFESILKLIIVLILFNYQGDKLEIYSVLFLSVNIVTFLLQMFFCREFPESVWIFSWDKKLFLEMFAFMRWNALIAIVESLNQQGVGILLNIHFGPIINAARGLAFQVGNALNMMSFNIYLAYRPQIMSIYLKKDFDQLKEFLSLSTRLSYFLILFFAIPLIINMKFILNLWLVDFPEDTEIFTVLVVIFVLIDSIRNPFWAVVQATGDVKRFAILGSVVFSINFPVSFLLLYFDFSPIVVFLSYIFFRIVYLITIMKILKDISIEIDFLYYWRFTLRPIIKVTIVSIVLPFLFVLILGERIEAFTFIIFSFLYTGLVIYKEGINLNERRYFKSKLKNYLRWQK